VATPTLSSHQIPGALGEILVDVRTTARDAAQPAVLLLHGFKGFKDYSFLPVFADRLARAGFTAVTASVSGSGVDSAGDFVHLERFARNTYSRELDDLRAIVDALVSGGLGVRSPNSIGVVGHSRGGGMAILLAREVDAIRAVVTWNGIGRARRHTDAELTAWRRIGRIEILHQRLRIRLPLDYEVAEDCLQHENGRLDIPAATVPFTEAGELARVAGEGHRFEPIQGSDHVWGCTHPWAGATPVAERVFDLTVRHFSRHLD
jgi:alpha-beta hydrolase superfamily lysophospholipase